MHSSKEFESELGKLGSLVEKSELFALSKSNTSNLTRINLADLKSQEAYLNQTIDKRGFFKQVRSCCSFSANTHVALDKQ